MPQTQYHIAHYAQNRAEILDAKRKYRESNLEILRARAKAFYEKHRAEILAKRAAYRKKNKERLRLMWAREREKYREIRRRKSADWYRANKQRKRVSTQRWRAAHPEAVLTYSAKSILRSAYGLKNSPLQLVELKREQLKIHRELRKRKQ